MPPMKKLNFHSRGPIFFISEGGEVEELEIFLDFHVPPCSHKVFNNVPIVFPIAPHIIPYILLKFIPLLIRPKEKLYYFLGAGGGGLGSNVGFFFVFFF